MYYKTSICHSEIFPFAGERKVRHKTKLNTTLKNILSVLLFYFIDFILFWQEYSRLNIILFWENDMWKIWTVINKNYSNMFALITDIFFLCISLHVFLFNFDATWVSVVMDRMSRMPSKCVVFCFLFWEDCAWSISSFSFLIFIQCHRNDYNHNAVVIRASNISCKY